MNEINPSKFKTLVYLGTFVSAVLLFLSLVVNHIVSVLFFLAAMAGFVASGFGWAFIVTDWLHDGDIDV